MSSSLDQRSAKGHEGHSGAAPGVAANMQSKEIDYSAMYQGQTVQGGYAAVGQHQSVTADPYMSSYYAPYMQYQASDAAAAGWSSRQDAAAAAAAMSYSQYAPMADYMSRGNMFGTYDYSWFPTTFDYSTGTWGGMMPLQPTAAAPQKPGRTGEYAEPSAASGAYYEVEASNGVPSVNGTASGGVSSVEQSMKAMRVSAEEDGAEQGNGGGNFTAPTSAARQTQSSAVPAKKSWANIASQPARAAGRPKLVPRAPVMTKSDVGPGPTGGSWENKTGPGQARNQSGSGAYSSSAGSARTAAGSAGETTAVPAGGWSGSEANGSGSASSSGSQYNPKEFDLNPKAARFFVIKSFSEDDIHRSIKYNIWCSTEYGNKRLDAAFCEREGKGPLYLFFSVNGSGHFCGVAQMISPVDYQTSAHVWAQDKWKGRFEVRWVYVKDVPNSQLRHIKLENNEGKPVTNSRDTQEVPAEKGKQVLRVIHQYRHTTSIFDDFQHYEKQQEETTGSKKTSDSRSD